MQLLSQLETLSKIESIGCVCRYKFCQVVCSTLLASPSITEPSCLEHCAVENASTSFT